MNTFDPKPAAGNGSRRGSRQIRALLAAGSVLGIGSVVTLAAWTDEVWAGADFSAGSFNIESSTTGANDFEDHSTEEDALSLQFNLSGEGMFPSSSVAAPLVLRVAEGTDYDAVVELDGATSTGTNADHITYGIVIVADAAACDIDATGTEVVPAGTALDATTDAESFDLTAGADGVAGDPVALCFQATSGPSLEQGVTATATWQFVATSVEQPGAP